MGGLGKREKVLLAILGIAVIFYLYFTFLLAPLQKDMDAVRSNIDKYQVQVDEIRSAKGIIEGQKKQLEELKVKFSDALKVLPERERNPEIIYNLKKLGDAKDVVINTYGIAEATESAPQETSEVNKDNNQNNNPPRENTNNTQGNQGQQNNSNNPARKKIFTVPVTLSVSGNYDSIMNFIGSIEKDKRFSLISTAGLSKDQTSGKLTGQITMAYFYSEDITKGELDYDFNNGQYGKTDLFK